MVRVEVPVHLMVEVMKGQKMELVRWKVPDWMKVPDWVKLNLHLSYLHLTYTSLRYQTSNDSRKDKIHLKLK